MGATSTASGRPEVINLYCLRRKAKFGLQCSYFTDLKNLHSQTFAADQVNYITLLPFHPCIPSQH